MIFIMLYFILSILKMENIFTINKIKLKRKQVSLTEHDYMNQN